MSDDGLLTRLAKAHESVKEDWAEYRDERPSDVREELWEDPLHWPDDQNEVERMFLRARQKRRRQFEWEGYDGELLD